MLVVGLHTALDTPLPHNAYHSLMTQYANIWGRISTASLGTSISKAVNKPFEKERHLYYCGSRFRALPLICSLLSRPHVWSDSIGIRRYVHFHYLVWFIPYGHPHEWKTWHLIEYFDIPVNVLFPVLFRRALIRAELENNSQEGT